MSDAFEELDFNQADKLVQDRQRFSRRPKKSADLIARLMARKGYGQQQSSEQLNQAWDSVAGDQWRNQTRVSLIRNGLLEILVASSVVNQQLEFEKKKLLIKLNQQLPNTKIRDIRFRIGNI